MPALESWARKGLEDGGLPWALARGRMHGQPALIPLWLDLQNRARKTPRAAYAVPLWHHPITQWGNRGPGRRSVLLHRQRSISPGAGLTSAGVQENSLYNVNFKTGSQEPSDPRALVGGTCWARTGPGKAVRRIGGTGFDFQPNPLLTHDLGQHISLFDRFSSLAD